MPADSAADRMLARALLRQVGTAALATLDASGGPFASYVTIAPADDGSPLLLLSRLAVHTRNLQRDARASLLLVREPDSGSAALAAARLTLTGSAAPDDEPEAEGFFLRRHPEASRYRAFADFSIYRFSTAAGHLVAGFGRIVSLTPAELLGEDD